LVSSVAVVLKILIVKFLNYETYAFDVFGNAAAAFVYSISMKKYLPPILESLEQNFN
jgi:hypothetical protein